MGDGLGKVGTLIQARMNSSRLPEKVLLPLAGRPMLGRVLDRHRLMRHGGTLVVVTSDSSRDDAVEKYCRGEGVACFRGSEEDVLDRYYQAARAHALEVVIRGTGDNPLVDPQLGDELVECFADQRADYATSKSVDVDSGLPDGVGLEVFSFAALQAAHRCGLAPNHREHINEFVLEHPERFRIAVLMRSFPAGRGQELRLTVDTAEDFAAVERIFRHFEGRENQMGLADIAAFCSGERF